MRYVAVNNSLVDAFRIMSIRRGDVEAVIRLDDGQQFNVSIVPEEPKLGDYYVRREDGHCYIEPRAQFEVGYVPVRRINDAGNAENDGRVQERVAAQRQQEGSGSEEPQAGHRNRVERRAQGRK